MKTTFVVSAALVAFGSIAFASAPRLNPTAAHTALVTQLGNASSTQTPYELLKNFYDSAPEAASLSDLNTCVETSSTSTNPTQTSSFNGHQILMVLKSNQLLGVDETTTREDIASTAALLESQHNFIFLGRGSSQYMVSPGLPASEAKPGQGPLFPAIPAHGEIPARYATLPQQMTFVQVLNNKVACSLIQKAADKSTLKSSTGLIDRALVTEADMPGYGVRLSVRKSGNLLAIKMMSGTSATSAMTTTYSYGWKN